MRVQGPGVPFDRNDIGPINNAKTERSKHLKFAEVILSIDPIAIRIDYEKALIDRERS